MRARLTRIEAKRRLDSLSLGPAELRIGRDPASDLVIEGARASRLHAIIRPLGDRHTISDTGSTNGTTVNGVALARAPVLLENGDLLEFAGESAYVYETGPRISTQRWLQAALVMVAFLLLSSTFAFWKLVVHQPVLAEAVELAREGRDAGARGDLLIADARLSEAARLLIRNGYLDHVDRAELMPAAMAQLQDELGDGSDLVALLGRAQKERRERADAVIGEIAEPATEAATGTTGPAGPVQEGGPNATTPLEAGPEF